MWGVRWFWVVKYHWSDVASETEQVQSSDRMSKLRKDAIFAPPSPQTQSKETPKQNIIITRSFPVKGQQIFDTSSVSYFFPNLD